MLGAITGDIIGSVYEFNNHRTKDFPLFGPDSTFTDDTVLTIATAHVLRTGMSYSTAYRDFTRRYPDRVYGLRYIRWVHGEDISPYNSFGNGSAMRVSPVGWRCMTVEQVLSEARRSAECTHDHPEGIAGAQAVALAIFMARTGSSKMDIKREIESRFQYDLNFDYEELRAINQFSESCQITVPQAIYCFLISADFEDALRTAVSIGGDTDTIASIAGAIAEAYYGGVPDHIQQEVLKLLPAEFIREINYFHQPLPKSMTKITLIKGDITEQEVDAIVNSANVWLEPGGGVDGAIHASAGPDLARDCVLLGGCSTGEAKITSGHNLPARHIIHTVAPEYEYEAGDRAELLRMCYLNSLSHAQEYDLKTIAFPALGVGIFRYPILEATEIAINAILEHIENEPDSIDEVRIVAFDEETYQVYRSVISSLNL